MNTTVRHDPPLIRVEAGPSRLAVKVEALRLLPVAGNGHYKLVVMSAPSSSGRQVRRGIWGKIDNGTAAQLLDLGVEQLRGPGKRSGKPPKWETGTFLVDAGKEGQGEDFREVAGLLWGGYGIARYYVDDGGAAIADDWNRPRPRLTHLRTGLAASPVLSVAKLKRYARQLVEVAPGLADVDHPRQLPGEQREAARNLYREIS
jgi:hypothetical protein